MSLEKPPFAALLLAGGRSRRMGCDKAFLPWNGVPMWKWQSDKLAALSPTRLLLSCRVEQRVDMTGKTASVEWLLDAPDHATGPLGILVRVLEMEQMPLLTLAVDMPRLPVEQIWRHWMEEPDRGFCFEAAHGFEPLAAVYVPAFLPLMRSCLETGRLGLQPMIREAADKGLMRTRRADEVESSWFTNLNTRQEFEHEKGGHHCPP